MHKCCSSEKLPEEWPIKQRHHMLGEDIIAGKKSNVNTFYRPPLEKIYMCKMFDMKYAPPECDTSSHPSAHELLKHPQWVPPVAVRCIVAANDEHVSPACPRHAQKDTYQDWSLATRAILVLCGWALSCWNDRRARCCSENGTSAGRAKNNQIRDGAPTDIRSNSPTWVDSIVAWWPVVQTLLLSFFLWCETIGLRMQ